MSLLRLCLQIRIGEADPSWRDWSASGLQALVLLPGQICCWCFKSGKIFSNFPIAVVPMVLVLSGNL